MSKQQIFSFSLDVNQDNELIGELLSRKNRSSYIRRALREVEKRKKEREEFDHLYEVYAKTYAALMKASDIDEYIIPEKFRFRK